MACVILPSETARLVYGYLVKENLNDIASLFLESSPYLTDCCQIVKNGYQFNTQLMGKNLQDLLQEYSVIHNLVNNKVSLLPKTSLLYKRIKLRCESLSEIVELILFWKYKSLKNEEIFSSSIENNKKEKGQTGDTSRELKMNNDNIYSNNVNNTTSVCNNSNNANSELLMQQNTDNVLPENYHSQLNSENYLGRNQMIVNEDRTNEEVDLLVLNNDNDKKNSKELIPMDVSQNMQINKNNNFNNNSSVSIHQVNNSPVSQLNLHNNILTIDVDSPNKNLRANKPSNEGPQCNEVTNEFENQIKIVRIENENAHQNHDLNSYLKPAMQQNQEVNVDNSVVFVSSDANVEIDQDRSQIIVIPIDYYKSQSDPQNKIHLSENDKTNFFQSKPIINQEEKPDVIFQDVPVNECNRNTSVVTSFYNDLLQDPGIDENIITESDFLQNKELMLNAAKEQPSIDRVSKKKGSRSLKINSNKNNIESTPIIVVSQAVVQKKPLRYRSILPKESKNELHPVVVVQPLVESNQEPKQINSSKKLSVKENIVVNKKKKKKISLVKQTTNKKLHRSESLNMPSIKAATAGLNLNENKEEKLGVKETADTESIVESDVINEEKENLEETKPKKTETPIFVSRRNSKRLSLSTPRRRTHIRALEFETPPKTKEEKKSRTLPKAKVGQVKVERKSVRNTLFKSPIPESVFKSPSVNKCNKKSSSQVSNKSREASLEPLAEPLSDLNSIPIATRSPNRKLSDAWENLTGVGCVIGQTENSKANSSKKMWDADLRGFISENCTNENTTEKKRVRKPEKNQKDNRKTVRKKPVSVKKSKKTPLIISPSKMSLTAKRNTYSINKNEENSPIRTLLDDLKIVTPFKDIDVIRPTEETPLTKLLRENINTIDIDLSMINTPSFPPTPSIVITPDLDDISLIAGTNYYTPAKECSKEKLLKITDYFRVNTENSNKKETKEMHDKVIDDLVCKAKEIIGIGKESQEDLKNRPTGKILSMVKIQMLSQCDKKLCENIPINEEANFSNSIANQSSSISNLSEVVTKSDLKEELEEKRKRALRKIKVVEENLSQTKQRRSKRNENWRKRKRTSSSSQQDDSKGKDSSESIAKHGNDSDERISGKVEIFHSTPYAKGTNENYRGPSKKIKTEFLEDIRQGLPPFQSDSQKYSELAEKSRKKLHYVEHFLKLPEISNFIDNFDEECPPKLFLKTSLRKFFQVFHKWLKHPHKHELNSSAETKALLENYLSIFNKLYVGLNYKNKKLKKESGNQVAINFNESHCLSVRNCHLSSKSDWKEKEIEKKKDDDGEDGLVSILPLKKRKSTVQQIEEKTEVTNDSDFKSCCSENATHTQNFLQDIDVDRFLSQIHGQANR